ncbi:MAG: RIP metalloprotease RseP [Alphaproteobacteria bacterium]|nr:RIP metalloprotease RseP [Alphaproteobacteria bacterium]
MLPAASALTPDVLACLALWAEQFPGGALLFTVGMFILLLSVLVFVHELGHYLAARSVRIKVLAFSIGFGRALLRWRDRHGTEWKVGWLPLGGYVQMLGQEDLQPSVASAQPGHYMSKTVAQRAWVVLAGPLANLLLGVVVLWGAFLLGEQKLRAEVGAVLPDMPAAGLLQPGDVIEQLNGVPVADWDALLEGISANPRLPLALTLQRGTDVVMVTVTPQVQTHTDIFGDTHQVGRIGIAPSGAVLVVPRGPVAALARAVERTYELTTLTLKSVWKLLIGAMGAENLTGPLGIANITGQAAHGGFYALLILAALISINLCVVNLFPLPILDGGHLVLLTLERLRGRPLGMVAQEWAFRVGLVCLVGLALLSTFNDVKRFGWLGGGSPAAAAQGSSASTP